MKRIIPQATVRRLSLYSRHLAKLEQQGVEFVSSQDLGEGIGTNAAQVRKDLCFFDRFGTPGRGYPVTFLRRRLATILGVSGNTWQVAVIGAGKLGAALIGYSGFVKQGFRFAAIFDHDPQKIGRRIGELEVQALDSLKEFITRQPIDIAVITVPAAAAQTVADQLLECGIKSLLNFAPATLNLPEGVGLRTVDVTVELESLSFHLINS